MSKINRNEPPLFEVDGKAVLTGLRRGDKLGRYAILAVRDPLGFSKDAADVIADSMTDVREITRNSMFTVLSGCYQDAQIIVCSTGSGGADTEIAMVDLMQYGGVDTFLRIGTSGIPAPRPQRREPCHHLRARSATRALPRNISTPATPPSPAMS